MALPAGETSAPTNPLPQIAIAMSEKPQTTPAASTQPASAPTPLSPVAPPPGETPPHPHLRPDTPTWLKAACGILLALMANQVRLPIPAQCPASGLLSKLAVSDIAFLAAFAVAGLHTAIRGGRLRLPLLCLLPVLASAAANIASGTGLGGALEVAQTAMLLVGGVALFSFMTRTMPRTTLAAVTAGLVLNLVAAAIQLAHSGAYLALAPRDVIELPWGIGAAMTGLFRSPTALAVYLAATLAWTTPQWLGLTARLSGLIRWLPELAVAAVTGVALLLLPNAPLALLAAAALTIGAAASSRSSVATVVLAILLAGLAAWQAPSLGVLDVWRATASPLKGYDYQPDAAVLFNSYEPILADDHSPAAHELRTSHYDLIAAVRTAVRNPLHGVGSGNYQKAIGKAYGLDEELRFAPLPKPQLNDIPTDTQSGWGILLATLGFPTTLAFALLLLAALGSSLRLLPSDEEDALRLHLGSALALAVLLAAMLLSDPLTKGVGWTLALALGSAFSLPAWRGQGDALCLGRRGLVGLLLLTAAAIAAIPLSDRLLRRRPQPRISRISIAPAEEPPAAAPAATPATTAAPQATDKAVDKDTNGGGQPDAPASAPQPQAVQAPADDSHVLKAPDEDELFLVFNAGRAVSVTLPMRKVEDEGGEYPEGVLHIPDKAGVPPAGKAPALEYGGCVFEFELAREATAYLWFNVLWDGSCGNTLDVAVDGSATSYTVGNDGTYNAWHWQKSPKTYHFQPGRHRIAVLNREDGIKLSQVLLLNDKDYIPEGKEEQ